ncbi:Golgi-associated plant pathogenesis-related protein 1 [Orchesella cincta]|uniref:Golgi-associated plant pathogenesis-related protein 1 n=1 Tax=Orchesella cincta TaxID=48709 RepID=A0A1D2M1U8_ORCCI|nr:Golgi-associated plant pathogenesis-related protein 1 [Orchesella cincta]
MGGKTLLSFIMLIAIFINPTAAAKEYQTVGQDVHNNFRSDHEVPPLELNEKLNEVAEKCADYYANERGEIDYSCPHKTVEMGENLYSVHGRSDSDEEIAKLAVETWYEELKEYSFSHPKNSDFNKTRRFTQLMWKGSKEMGFGVAFRNERIEYIVAVALYTPPGNIQDEHDWHAYKQNVVKPFLNTYGAGLVKEESGASRVGQGTLLTLSVAVVGTLFF